jgi:CubicO group peptidase (beta-lactamase class C family)
MRHCKVISTIYKGIRIVIALALLLIILSVPTQNADADAIKLHTSSAQNTPMIPPEAYGIDSAYLADMFAAIHENSAWKIDGIILMRNGEKVIEVYRHPYAANIPHIMYSVAKNFDAALTGIALDQGVITSLDTTLGDVYGTDHPATIEQLVTMSAGIEWQEHPYTSSTSSLNMILAAPDPVDYFLNLDLKESTEFNYCTGCMDMLLAVIEANGDQSAHEFAQTYLFNPLSVDNWAWDEYQSGLIHGAGLSLTLPDLVRFGQLYLNNGVWNGQQVIPADWVMQSTRPQIVFNQAQTSQWLGANGYGYGWWTFDNGGYAAMGSGGQLLYVLPEYDVVIGIVAGIMDQELNPIDLVNDYVLPALHAESLPENPEAAMHLEAELERYAQLIPRDPGPLPALAETISGKAFEMEENPLGIEHFTLTFIDPHQALFEQTGQSFLPSSMILGLDSVAAANTWQEWVVGGAGAWDSDTTFTMIWRVVSRGSEWHFRFNFGQKGEVTILTTTQSVAGSQSLILRGSN